MLLIITFNCIFALKIHLFYILYSYMHSWKHEFLFTSSNNKWIFCDAICLQLNLKMNIWSITPITNEFELWDPPLISQKAKSTSYSNPLAFSQSLLWHLFAAVLYNLVVVLLLQYLKILCYIPPMDMHVVNKDRVSADLDKTAAPTGFPIFPWQMLGANLF